MSDVRIELLAGVIKKYVKDKKLDQKSFNKVVKDHSEEVKAVLGDIKPSELRKLYAPVKARIETQNIENAEGASPQADGTPTPPADGTPTPPADGTPTPPADGTPTPPADGTPTQPDAPPPADNGNPPPPADNGNPPPPADNGNPPPPADGTTKGLWEKWGLLTTAVVGVLALLGSLFTSQEGGKGRSLFAAIGGLLVGSSIFAKWPWISEKLFGKPAAKSAAN